MPGKARRGGRTSAAGKQAKKDAPRSAKSGRPTVPSAVRPARGAAAPAGFTVGMAQMEVVPGDPARNAAAMLALLAEAREQGVDLLAFPEMCLPGYLLGDMWERPAFLRECEVQARRVVEATRGGGPAVIFGTVAVEWGRKGEDGRPRKYNAYVAARAGRALRHPALGTPYGIKTLLPNYREFEEPRHFQDTRKLALETGRPLEDLLAPLQIPLRGGAARVGVILCEDAWDDDYAQKPLDILGRQGCDLVLNLSCSPFTQGKNAKRHRVFGRHAARLGLPLFYVNAVSLQNNAKTLFTFDGRSTAYGPDGSVAAELPAFAATLGSVRLEREAPASARGGTSRGASPKRPAPARGKAAARPPRLVPILPPGAPAPYLPDGLPPPPEVRIREIHAALRYGARAYLAASGIRRVVIGASGGIDSAVAAALYREILPPQDLLLVNMPSRFNSGTTRALAHDLAARLGCLYAEVPIEDSVALTRAQMDGLEARSPDGSHTVRIALEGLALENVQARDRSSRILAALAAGFGGAFTCNANKAELTVGYSTLYGDLGGFLALIGDLWKGEVYALGRHLNREAYGREVIPEGVFTVVPSAELSSNQAVDEGKGDPLVYPYHDRLFFAFVQRWQRATPEEVLSWWRAGTLARELGLPEPGREGGVDLDALFPTAEAFVRDLEKWWDIYNGLAVAKRVQAPPVLAVSSRAFGFDHREALGRPFYSGAYQALKAEVLAGRGNPAAENSGTGAREARAGGKGPHPAATPDTTPPGGRKGGT